MFRHVLFAATCGGILMAAGLLPTPTSREMARISSAIQIPELLEISKAPALIDDLSGLLADLPQLARGPIQDEELPLANLRPTSAAVTPPMPVAPDVPDLTSSQFLVHFEFDKSFLDSAAQRQLESMIVWLEANPEGTIGIFGHTDLVGTEEYNLELGQLRADQVALYLQARGVDPSRISLILSLGETEPLVQTEERSRQNRRVQVATSLNRIGSHDPVRAPQRMAQEIALPQLPQSPSFINSSN